MAAHVHPTDVQGSQAHSICLESPEYRVKLNRISLWYDGSLDWASRP